MERSGVGRVRLPVCNWVQEADLEPEGGKSPAAFAIDESVIHLDGERY